MFKEHQCYPQDGDLVLPVSHQQWETCQRFLQVLTKNLHPLGRRHLFVLLILALHKTTNQQLRQYNRI